MAGRPKIYDEEVILDKAVSVFWERGYENASADEILVSITSFSYSLDTPPFLFLKMNMNPANNPLPIQ